MNIKDDRSFEACFKSSSFILTEAAIVERLKKEFNIKLDENIMHAALIYEDKQAEILSNIYKQYIEVAVKYNLPIMLMTPTRRANKERIECSNYSERNILKDCVEFLSNIRNSYENYKDKIFIGGLMGCKGDAYNGEDALSAEESYKFHLWQAEQFRNAGAEYLFAGIMPNLKEAIGMAKAMEETKLPYIISFMIRKNGRLLDGTTINSAIEVIDNVTNLKPLGYAVNCIHPAILNEALSCHENRTDLVKKRFVGIQANASPLSPEELDNCCDIKSDSPEHLADEMKKLFVYNEMKIFGGCCGTYQSHLEEIAKRIKNDRMRLD